MPKRIHKLTKKQTSKRSPKSPSVRTKPGKPFRPAAIPVSSKDAGSSSKQSRVIAMLQSPGGTTIDAMMQQTGWQQHSVRGFLAGVVRKKLKLKLQSDKVGGSRVYRVSVGPRAKTPGLQAKSPSTQVKNSNSRSTNRGSA